MMPLKSAARENQPEQDPGDYKWTLSLYGGLLGEDTLNDILTFSADYSDDNTVVVAGLARELYRYRRMVSLQLEGLVGKHFGQKEDHWEFVIDLLGRWHTFPWNRYLKTTAAAGAGLSYYTKVSEVEKEHDEDAQRLLGYLALELTFGLPQFPRWNLMIRIHHRSGAGNAIGPAYSNFLCGGVKFAF
jgi:hypothetical protein